MESATAKRYRKDHVDEINTNARRRYRTDDRVREQKNTSSKRNMRWYRYGLTEEAYQKLIADQDDCCGICGRRRDPKGKALHIDHDHETGKVRGLLCSPCNGFLGRIGDSIEDLEKVRRYLIG